MWTPTETPDAVQGDATFNDKGDDASGTLRRAPAEHVADGRDRQVRGAGRATAAITEARPIAKGTEARRITQPARHSDRCGSCGQFLRHDSLYTNRCSDCWGPEDEFLW